MHITIPRLGLGTFRLKDRQAIDAVATGLEPGYRHIDTAQIHGNEAEVGQALAASGVARADVFVMTKDGGAAGRARRGPICRSPTAR